MPPKKKTATKRKPVKKEKKGIKKQKQKQKQTTNVKVNISGGGGGGGSYPVFIPQQQQHHEPIIIHSAPPARDVPTAVPPVVPPVFNNPRVLGQAPASLLKPILKKGNESETFIFPPKFVQDTIKEMKQEKSRGFVSGFRGGFVGDDTGNDTDTTNDTRAGGGVIGKKQYITAKNNPVAYANKQEAELLRKAGIFQRKNEAANKKNETETAKENARLARLAKVTQNINFTPET